MSDQEQSIAAKWRALKEIGIDMAERKRHHHAVEASFYEDAGRILARDRGTTPEIRYIGVSDQPFIVAFPPFLPNHFDGNGVLAPFGETHWKTWEEAKSFFDRVIEGVEAGTYNETWRG